MGDYFQEFIVNMKIYFKSWNAWISVFKIIITKSFSIVTNPSFIIFSILAIGASTMGIWIVFLSKRNRRKH